MEVAEELGTVFKDSGMEGLQSKYLWDVLQGCGAVDFFIRIRNVGAEPLHGTGAGKLPAKGH